MSLHKKDSKNKEVKKRIKIRDILYYIILDYNTLADANSAIIAKNSIIVRKLKVKNSTISSYIQRPLVIFNEL